MGSSQRLAAIAAVSHAKQYYNNTPEVSHANTTQYNVNAFFVSATLCGVLVAVCAACWRRGPPPDKPDDAPECAGLYTVSADSRLAQLIDEEAIAGPPPAYEAVVHSTIAKNCHLEVVTERCPRCAAPDGELPTYEAAVMLRDTKL